MHGSIIAPDLEGVGFLISSMQVQKLLEKLGYLEKLHSEAEMSNRSPASPGHEVFPSFQGVVKSHNVSAVQGNLPIAHSHDQDTQQQPQASQKPLLLLLTRTAVATLLVDVGLKRGCMEEKAVGDACNGKKL